MERMVREGFLKGSEKWLGSRYEGPCESGGKDGFVSQTTFPSPCNDAQVATDSGWIKIQAALENAARCIPLCGLVHGEVFR
jgi:hypothetical protein